MINSSEIRILPHIAMINSSEIELAEWQASSLINEVLPMLLDTFNSTEQLFQPVEKWETSTLTSSKSLRAALTPILAWICMVLVGTIGNKSSPFASLSLISTVRELVAKSEFSTRLDVLDVFRVIGILWVMVNHTGSEGRIDILEGRPSATAFKAAIHEHPIFGPLLGNSALGVEIFLVLSGLLAARTWSKLSGTGALHCLRFIGRRWLRLFPSMAVFLYLAAGPIMEHLLPRFHITMISNCGQSGLIYHLTFIGNWQPTPTCMGYLWYLGLDMQLYVLAPCFLWFISKKSVKWAAGGTVAILALSAAIRAAYCRIYGVCNRSDVDIPFIYYPGQDPMAMAKVYVGLWEMYARPYTKCGPFVLGLVLGYATVHFRWQLTPAVARRLFWASFILCLLVIYGILPEYWYPNQGDTIYNTLYTALFRTVFAIGLCGMIAAVFYNVNSTSINIIWSILARLSFTAYLVHMPIVYCFNHLQFLQTAIGPFELLAVFPMVAGLSFAMAFVFYAFVESPIGRLSGQIKKNLKRH